MITAEKAIKNFMEQYSADAIASITEMAEDKTLYCVPFKAVSFKEANKSFREFLEGYVAYQCDENHQEKPLSEILESAKNYVNTSLFTEKEITYDTTPDFVGCYMEQMLELDNLANQSIGALLENGVDNEAVGLVSEMVSAYVEAACNVVNPVVDRMLMASGYTNKHKKRETAKTSSNKDSFVI